MAEHPRYRAEKIVVIPFAKMKGRQYSYSKEVLGMPFSKKLIVLFILSALIGCGRKESDDEVGVAVLPTFFKLPAGGEVLLSADVSGTLDKGVAWQINGPGSIDPATGLYRSDPNFDSNRPTATVQAVSQDDPSAIGFAAITMTASSKLSSDPAVPVGSRSLVMGGYAVRAGQTIDLNGDSLLDLVSVSRSRNRAVVFLGVGNGLFRKQAEISVVDPSGVIVGDFVNSEAFIADLAIGSRNERAIKIISGEAGSPHVPFPVTVTTHPLTNGEIPSALAAGQFHGDVASRNSDLIVGTEEGSIVLFLQDRSTNQFSQPSAIAVGGKVTQMVTADFNGDESLDLAVLRDGAGDVSIFLGDGAGAFSGPVSVPFTSPPTSLAVGDLNGDNIIDLAAAHQASSQVSTSNGKGDGTFLPAAYLSVEFPPGAIVVEDFNLDRINETPTRPGNPMLDIAVTLPSLREILVLFGDGTGKFIGKFNHSTGTTTPVTLISGFFLTGGFQSPQGFQSVSLVYLSETEDKFHLLNNISF